MSLNLPAVTPQTSAPSSVRDPQAAVRAFFQAATNAVAPQTAAVAAARAPAPVRPTPVIDPERPLRPGSFVDIRV